MAKLDQPKATRDGYRPIPEGYQPGNVLQKGYTPTAKTNSGPTPENPPSGGSSAKKPAQTEASSGSQKGG